MKKQFQINPRVLKFFILILAIALPLNLNSCLFTVKTLEFAKEKASPVNIEYWRIKSVVSDAVKQANGDISVCVELKTPSDTKEYKLDTLTLPISTLTRKNNAFESFGLLSDENFGLLPECQLGGVSCFWYPIEKLQDGCEFFTNRDLSTSSVLPIEKLEVYDYKELNQIYDLLNSKRSDQQVKEKIYEVIFIPDGKPPLNFSRQAIDEEKKEFKVIFLIFWPDQQVGQQSVHPISIAGMYEDNRTYIYYIFIPPAIIVDALIFYLYVTN